MVQEWKVKQVESLAKDMESHKVIGVIDMYKLPAAQLQNIKKELRGKATVKMAKKRLIRLAIEKVKGKENIKALEDLKAKTPALIFSNENPFTLQKQAEKSKADSFAKAGDIAPKDIIVPAGDTNLAPGPIIGELQKSGVKARIAGQFITISEDSLVAKTGDEIDEKLAAVLTRLNVKPVQIGLNILGVYEDGTVFPASMLSIDEGEYVGKIQQAYAAAFNLSMNSGYPTSETITHMVSKAQMDALNLAVNANVVNSKTVQTFIKKAQAQASAIASRLPSEAGGAPAAASAPQAAPEEKPAEEKKEEPKEEPKGNGAAGLGALFG